AAAHPVPPGLAGGTDHSALSLEDEVERRAVAVGPVLAEAGDRAVDDAGVPLARGLVAEPEPREGAHPVVLQHHVALVHEPKEETLSFRVLQVHLDALLVAVQAHEVGRFAAGQRRAPGARDVASLPGLELYVGGGHAGPYGGADR